MPQVFHNLVGILGVCLRAGGIIFAFWCRPQAEPSIPFWEDRRKPSLHARMRRGACTVIPSNSRALAPSLTNLRPMCRPYSPSQTTPCNVPYMAVNCSLMRIWWQMNLFGTWNIYYEALIQPITAPVYLSCCFAKRLTLGHIPKCQLFCNVRNHNVLVVLQNHYMVWWDCPSAPRTVFGSVTHRCPMRFQCYYTHS